MSALGEELRPGLRHWMAHHPSWKQPVGCAAIVREGQLVLLDPQLEAEHWGPLERLARGREVHVMLTIHWHARSAAEIAGRFPGTRVWAHSRDRAAVGRRVEVTDAFRPGDPLPAAITPIVARPRTEVLFWDEQTRALFVGDALIEDDDGLRICPASWLPSSTDVDELRTVLQPLLDLPVELVLASHGDPIESGSARALAGALAQG